MFGSAKYRNFEYGADDHVAVIDTSKYSLEVGLFLTTAYNKSANTGIFPMLKFLCNRCRCSNVIFTNLRK